MRFNELPKIELHCHLDGCLRTKTVIELAKKENIEIESLDYEKVEDMLVVPEYCASLDIYLRRFDLPGLLMQNKENLKRISYELIEDVNKENVKYIEIRFAPLFHVAGGLSVKEVINAILEGLREGEKDFGVKSNLIICIMRHHDLESGYKLIEDCKEFIGNGVVAVDLAGGELEGFAPKYEDMFKVARSYGYRVTVHAGETGFAQNVIDAITLLGAERIGHAVAIQNNKEAYNLVRDNKITLEMCPKSNLDTKAVTSYKTHPLRRFLNDGLEVNLSTDNRTVSNIDLTTECKNLNSADDISFADYKKIYANSVNGAFCNSNTKEYLMSLI
ncbi:MAG: adenosine deaminase [Sarcina sp.]